MNEIEVVFLIVLIASALCGLIGTYIIKNIFSALQIVDDPTEDLSRKKQTQAIPLGIGNGFVLTALALCDIMWLLIKFNILQADIWLVDMKPFKLLWINVAIILLLIAGYLDDTKKTSSFQHIFIIGLAILIITFLGGISVDSLSYPFDSLLPQLPFLPELLASIWIGLNIMTTKFLDGLDGFVSSIGIIGLLTISSVAMMDNVNQPLIVLFALIWAVSILSFMSVNFPDASAYLGEGPSIIIGAMIGILSLISGAKIATAGSVVGLFILDLVLVWYIRVSEKRNPLTSADRNHWPQRMFDNGLSKIQVLSITAIIILINAYMGLLLPTSNKAIIVFVQAIILLAAFGLVQYKKRLSHNKNITDT